MAMYNGVELVPIEKLGFNLKKEREKRGWTQLDLANAAGIGYYAYRGMETGTIHSTAIDKFEKLKEIFSSEKVIRNTDYVPIEELGFDMKEMREKAGISQRAMAKKIGIAFQTYQSWEKGITKYLRKENYEKLKELFENL